MYIIFDLRAVDEDGLEDALVLDTADTMPEAREAAKDQGGGVIWREVKDHYEFVEIVHCGDKK